MADETLSWLDEFFGRGIVLEEGVPLPARGRINFVGTDVTATDDPANKRTNVTFVGGPPVLNANTGTLNAVPTTSGGSPARGVRFSGAAPAVTGFASGTDGRYLIVSTTGGPLVLRHEDVTEATATNRIKTPSGADLTIPDEAGALLWYEGDTQRWRVIATGSGGSALPENWEALSEGRLHQDYKVMTGGPSLDFAGSTITRGFGSWVDDRFEQGDTIDIRRTSSNDGRKRVASVTPTVLTLTTPVTTESVPSTTAFIEGGGTLTTADATATRPEFGLRRHTQPSSTAPYPELVLDAVRNFNGYSVPVVAVNAFGDLCVGGLLSESNLVGGVVNRRARKVAIFSEQFRDYSDLRSWEDDKGFTVTYKQERRAHVVTNDASPTALGLTFPSALGGAASVCVEITARNGGGPKARWIFVNGVLVDVFKDAGAASWNATLTTVTGQAATQITWDAYAVAPGARPTAVGAGVSNICTLEQFGAIGDGTTDDTAAWNAAEAALAAGTYKAVQLGVGRTYLVTSTFTLPTGCSVLGYGSASVIKTTADLPIIVVAGERAFCRDFRMQGDNGTSAQFAIQVGSGGSCFSTARVTGIEVEDFYNGIVCTGGSTLTYAGPIISDCRAIDCNKGFVTELQAEYVTFVNCHASQALVAVRSPGSGFDIASGNVKMIGCSSERNVYGERLLTGTNDAHGQAIGCSFNHNASPCLANAIVNGHTHVGCHVYGGEMWLNGCTGVDWVDTRGYLDAGSGLLANSAVRCQIINWHFTAATAFAFDSTSSVTPERCYGNATALKNLGAYVRKAYTMADSNQTLSAQDSCASTLVVSGTLTATRDLTISRAPSRFTIGSGAMLVINTTTQTINVGWSSGTKVAVAAGAKAHIGDDGTNAFVEAA